ncbi:GFA family protein [Ferrimonas aestuarii]|nr:GFA family protein [Ferrimonas aestuarii]
MIRKASCSCGQVTLFAEGEPSRISICHCSACQKRTGNVFATQARFEEAQIRVEGDVKSYCRQADSGNGVWFEFCPNCATTLCYRLQALPGVIGVPVGLFADSDFPAPQVSVYEARQHPWVRLPEQIEHID